MTRRRDCVSGLVARAARRRQLDDMKKSTSTFSAALPLASLALGGLSCTSTTTTACATDAYGNYTCASYASAYPYDYTYVDPLYSSYGGYYPYSVDTYYDPYGYSTVVYALTTGPAPLAPTRRPPDHRRGDGPAPGRARAARQGPPRGRRHQLRRAGGARSGQGSHQDQAPGKLEQRRVRARQSRQRQLPVHRQAALVGRQTLRLEAGGPPTEFDRRLHAGGRRPHHGRRHAPARTGGGGDRLRRHRRGRQLTHLSGEAASSGSTITTTTPRC